MESEAQRSPSQCSRALELFLYFFKIGFYTFGGGWSIVAQIQQEYVQKKGWITDEDLLDITSVGRSLPGLKSSNFNMRSFGERVALNMPIQGTAADIIKLAMVNVDRRLRSEGLEARLILQVHDELIVECPESEAERVSELLKYEMEHAAQLAVPLTVDVKTGKSWAEAH